MQVVNVQIKLLSKSDRVKSFSTRV